MLRFIFSHRLSPPIGGTWNGVGGRAVGIDCKAAAAAHTAMPDTVISEQRRTSKYTEVDSKPKDKHLMKTPKYDPTPKS